MACSLARQLSSYMIYLVYNDYSILLGVAHHQYYNFLYFCGCMELQYIICI